MAKKKTILKDLSDLGALFKVDDKFKTPTNVESYMTQDGRFLIVVIGGILLCLGRDGRLTNIDTFHKVHEMYQLMDYNIPLVNVALFTLQKQFNIDVEITPTLIEGEPELLYEAVCAFALATMIGGGAVLK